MTNLPERALSAEAFVESKPNLGTAHYYSRFLFWGASEVDTLSYSITPQFSPQAIEAGSKVTFAIEADGCDTYVDGKPATTFTLEACSQRTVRIGVVFDTGASQGRHGVKLCVVNASQLDCVLDTRPATAFSYPMTASFERDWNPLKHILMWLGIVCGAALLLWFSVLKRSFFPIIKVGHLRITEPYYSDRPIKGARQVVLTNKAIKQSAWSRLFTGRIVCEVNPAWAAPIVLEPSRGQVRMKATSAYTIDPFAYTLMKQTEYTLTHNDSKQKYKISVY